MSWVESFLIWLESYPIWLGLLILGAAATIEYVVPPFPGDSIVVVGAVLVGAAEWPWWGVWGSVIAGSMIGAMLNLWFGRWLNTRDEDHRAKRWLQSEKVAPKLTKIKAQLERHDALYLILNRFVPAFRGLIFIAAGMTGLPVTRVLFLAGISAALWNAMLVVVGTMLGYHLEGLLNFVQTYTRWVLGGIFVLIALWWLTNRIRHRRQHRANKEENHNRKK